MPQLSSVGLRALYELVHLTYSVLVFLSYLLSLVTTPVERRALLHRCLHPLSPTQPPAPPTAASFVPSASLISSSLPPFPSFNKHPTHLAIAFPSTHLHYPLLPYLILWALQSGSHSLTLHSPSSVYLHCVSQLASSLAELSRREEGAPLQSVEVLIRTKRRLLVHEARQWTAEDRGRLLDVVRRGQLPTVSEVWSVNGGKCWKHDSQHCVFNEEQRETSSRLNQAKPAANGKHTAKMDDEQEEETKEATDRTPSSSKRRTNGVAPHNHANGHPVLPSHPTPTPSLSPFIVTLTAAEHTWDDIVNSTYNIALPAAPSTTVPFPPPNDPAPPSSVLRSHILATAFPLYPMSEPNLLLVFTSPLSLLSFPPWLQRLCELDNRPARHAAVWTRREFEQIIERYSSTVQRGGA